MLRASVSSFRVLLVECSGVELDVSSCVRLGLDCHFVVRLMGLLIRFRKVSGSCHAAVWERCKLVAGFGSARTGLRRRTEK